MIVSGGASGIGEGIVEAFAAQGSRVAFLDIQDEAAENLIRRIAAKRHPEQGYRSCLGILRLGKQYSSQRLEAAARRAIVLKACSYQSVKSILQCNLDGQPIEPAAQPKPPLDHPNIRGAEYFDTGEPPTLQ